MAPLEGEVAIIYPPPEVRNIVDKTATFVARNGPEFENRIKQHEVNNPKFNFLNPGDPYHAYYQHKVVEIRDGKPEAPAEAAASSASAPAKERSTTQASEAVKQRQSELLKQAQKEIEPPPPKEPPPEFEFIAEPPSISAFDLDVVKLTAQFVARNGRQFLTSLMNREQRNYQFDFLRPQHSLFQYFTKLLEQYTKVLIPPKDLMQKLDREGETNKAVLEAIDYRVRWLRHQEQKKKREEEEAERERVSYAQIDWHNFVVVETVDYQPWEAGNFPPPTNPEEVGARVLMQRRVETQPPPARKKDDEDVANTQVEDMEEGSSSEDDEEADEVAPSDGMKPPDAAPAVMAPPSLGNVEVRKYDPKQKAAVKVTKANEAEFVSPLTGETVPAHKVQEHMRIGLLDPRWVEERDKQITARATEDAVFAPGQSIENSLKHLAERRTDIFGVGEEADKEADIGRTMDEETMESQAEAAAMARTEETRPAAVSAPPAAPSIPAAPPAAPRPPLPQVAAPPRPPMPAAAAPVPPVAPAPPVQVIPVAPPPQQFFMPPQVPQSFAPPPGGMLPPMGHGPPPPQTRAPAPPMAPGGHMEPMPAAPDDEPPNKRPRGEDHLIPEEIFLARSPAPEVTFVVLVPQIGDKPEWKCSGQQLQLTLPLTDPVSVIKARLHDETGMPPGKQKLQMDSLFLKDANSLAYYNLKQGGLISLQVKERGGRKK